MIDNSFSGRRIERRMNKKKDGRKISNGNNISNEQKINIYEHIDTTKIKIHRNERGQQLQNVYLRNVRPPASPALLVLCFISHPS